MVELKLYHLPGEAAPSLPRLHLPGRIPSVALAPAEAGGLVVSWEASPNAAEAEVLEYHVFLKREADDWSEAQRQVSTAKGQTGGPVEPILLRPGGRGGVPGERVRPQHSNLRDKQLFGAGGGPRSRSAPRQPCRRCRHPARPASSLIPMRGVTWCRWSPASPRPR